MIFAGVVVCAVTRIFTEKAGIRWDRQRLTEECQSLNNLIRDAYLAYPDGKAWAAATREAGDSGQSGMGRFGEIHHRCQSGACGFSRHAREAGIGGRFDLRPSGN